MKLIIRFFSSVNLFCLLMAAGSSCESVDLFEKNTVIPGQKWASGYEAKGSFQIRDTSAAYYLYVVLRHTDAYAYQNIWLDVALQSPGDVMYHNKVNLTLGSDAEGWEGTGMNDIWEVRKKLHAQPRRFKKPGIYHFSIRQIMRDDPLPQVMSAGMRIEKAIP